MSILTAILPASSTRRPTARLRRPSVFSAHTEKLEVRMMPAAAVASTLPAGVPSNAVELPPPDRYTGDGLLMHFYATSDRIYGVYSIDPAYVNTSQGNSLVTPRTLTLATYTNGGDRSLLTQKLIDSQTTTIRNGETKVLSAKINCGATIQYDTWQYGAPSSFPDNDRDGQGDYNGDSLISGGGGVYTSPGNCSNQSNCRPNRGCGTNNNNNNNCGSNSNNNNCGSNSKKDCDLDLDWLFDAIKKYSSSYTQKSCGVNLSNIRWPWC